MIDQKRFALRTFILLIAAGLFVFLLYLYFFVPFAEMAKTIQKINSAYFLMAFCALFVNALFYSLAWQCLLKLLSVDTSFLKVFQFTWVESFVNLTIPASPISGDFSRIYLMSKQSGGNAGKVTASVVGHRILTTFVTVAGLTISAIYFALRYRLSAFVLELVVIIAAGSILYIGLLFYVSIRKEVAEKIASWLTNLLTRLSGGRWRLEGLKKSTVNILGAFHEGILTLGNYPKGLILPLLLSIFAWVSDIFIAVLVFLSLGSLEAAIPLSAIVIVYSITVAVEYVPIGIVPGEVGLVEIVMTTLFAVLGNTQAIAVFAVATVLIRLLTFWVRLVVGGLMVQLLGIKSLVSSVESSEKL
jgi:uncharacterized protein (TIRG00374 family)